MSVTSHRYSAPSTATAVWAVASLTLLRARRGRAIWITALIATLPVIFASLNNAYGHAADRAASASLRGIFATVMLTLAISPAMNIASSVGEELEERTMAYLWSRPLARWTIIGGKLLALAPMVALLAVAGTAVACQAGNCELNGSLLIAVAVAAIAFSFVSAAVATIAPKNGMTLAICYALFIDLALGALPISLRYISVSHHAGSIAGINDDGVASGAIATAVIVVLWTAIGLWRIRKIE
jgi:ABC-type transport system involved in multi-copper enzyme maturation permease subunit